jgi:gamma-glutamyltranspeptidase/glutathione hydrolase
LSRDRDAAALFLEEGQWPPLISWTAVTEKHLDQRKLSHTLETIAKEGPKALYGGDVGRALAKDIQDKGGSLSLEDLAGYRPHMVDALEVPYRGGRVFAAPGMTGGPTLALALNNLRKKEKPGYIDYARALNAAWSERLQTMGDKEGCTTHFSVVDRAGNLCSVTQTLLSVFGARVVSPSTGIPLNNGIMWFDPEPGKPNSLAPDKRCLGNYCPVVGETPKGARFALGASGGRKILGTVLQMSSFMIDHGASLEEAFHRPRIDMSGEGRVIADRALPPAVIKQLGEFMTTTTVRRGIFPYAFAVPAGVLREREMNMGCTEIMSPWGDAVAEKERQ